MKRLQHKLFHKSSVVQVLFPFFWFHNFFGLCTINLNSKHFAVSKFSVVKTLANFLSGVYCMSVAISIGVISTKSFRLFSFGVTLVLNKGIVCSLLTILLNFGARKHLRKLLKTLVRHDELAKTVFIINHQKEFLILLTFWISKNLFLVLKSFDASRISLRPPILNVYITLNFYAVNDLSIMILVLIANRMRCVRHALANTSVSTHYPQDYTVYGKLRTYSILITHSATCVGLVSKSFGVQMMLWFATASFMGMFTIFTGLETMLNVASPELNGVFNTYIYYALFSHSILVVICVLNSVINYQVISKQMLTSDVVHSEPLLTFSKPQVAEIRRTFRSLTSRKKGSKIFELPNDDSFSCGFFCFDWKFLISVRFYNEYE